MTIAVARQHKNMLSLAGGSFRMGSDAHYPEEQPAHDRVVGPFWMDAHPVTNAEFRRFVRHTGYVTVAEQPPPPRIFRVRIRRIWFRGRSCSSRLPDRCPSMTGDVGGGGCRGPAGRRQKAREHVDGRELHPVVHVAFDDACAYAEWAGKRFPPRTSGSTPLGGRPATTYRGERSFSRTADRCQHLAGALPVGEPEPARHTAYLAHRSLPGQ